MQSHTGSAPSITNQTTVNNDHKQIRSQLNDQSCQIIVNFYNVNQGSHGQLPNTVQEIPQANN
jgi:hypothetical protein